MRRLFRLILPKSSGHDFTHQLHPDRPTPGGRATERCFRRNLPCEDWGMPSASLKKLMLVGLLAPAGCYSPYGNQSPYGYQPYGQPYQPAYPGNPVYTAPPGQPYVPGGSTPGTGSPTPITPPSTYDTPGGGSSGGNAPTFDPNPPSGSSGGNRVVPNPEDDLAPAGGPAATNPGGLTPTASQRDSLESSFEQESNQNNAPARPARISEEEDPFEMPERTSSSQSGVFQNVNYVAPPEGLNPYGRDTKHANPEWLRGILEYDRQTKTWQITYAGNPDPRDRNGGSITLAKHPDLSLCRSGDIVLVEGAIDGSQTDARGKAIYLLDKVTPLAAQ